MLDQSPNISNSDRSGGQVLPFYHGNFEPAARPATPQMTALRLWTAPHSAEAVASVLPAPSALSHGFLLTHIRAPELACLFVTCL